MDEPENIDRKIEGIPIYIVAFLIQDVLEGNGHRRPNNVEQHDSGHEAVPNLHREGQRVELVPWDVGELRLVRIALVLAIDTFIIAGRGVRWDRLIKHLG